MALLIGLHEARCFNFRHLCIEGDSYCAVQWAGGISNPPWYLADILEEVIDLSKSMKVSFHHIKPNSNGRQIFWPKREFLDNLWLFPFEFL